MAQLYSTGPAAIYASIKDMDTGTGSHESNLLTVPPKSETFFLGTCQRAPLIVTKPAWLPIMASRSGPIIARDHLFVGEMAVISLQLNKWNERVARKLTAHPQLTGTRGQYSVSDIGRPALLSGRGMAFSLWVYFPFADEKASYYSDLPRSYRFPGTIHFGPQNFQSGAASIALTFVALPVYDSDSGNAGANRRWVLYTEDEAFRLPAVPPIDPDGIVT